MNFPLSIPDISLWLAACAIIVLMTSELFLSSTGVLRNLAVDRNRFRLIALLLGMGFIVSIFAPRILRI
jgi:hypothetical protein